MNDSDHGTQLSIPKENGTADPAASTILQSNENEDVDTTQSNGLEGGLSRIGVDLGDETISNDFGPMLHTEDLRQIQEDIANTSRPTWQASPPANFGSPAHGKLKADQWRTCIEFDLPVSLMNMWSTEVADVPEEIRLRRQRVLESTMLLSMAIRWATSHQTSARHVEAAQRYLGLYLKSLRDLCPNMDLHPVHHNALHLPEFLLRYGPIHGWWMFPFERLIGILQKVNNNYKIG